MDGKIRIRSLSNWSIMATILLATLCVVFSIYGLSKYAILRNVTQDYISYETAVRQLNNGSDNLTKQVRLAAATGQQEYIDAYFEEANVTKTREKALEDLAALDGNADALASLQDALTSSNDLMEIEYYSMRLVEEASGIDPSLWPDKIKAVQLLPEDAARSSSEKLCKAQMLVISPDYEAAKAAIASDVNAALGTLTTELSNRQTRAANIFTDVFREILICVLIFAVMMLFISLIMRFWIVNPLLAYTDSIQHGDALPVCGARELQVLANTFNKVYEENEEREMLMKHQAEHDPLTEALNRGSFDRILNMYEKDQNQFALILIDVDAFKGVNDTYGHTAGDAVLKKVTELLKTEFRTVDYVCRIGGDEFAVIMVDMNSSLRYTIEEKIAAINRKLAIAEEGIPAVSLSVGVALTDRANPGESLFKDADSALYYTKEHGRSGCSFYPVP